MATSRGYIAAVIFAVIAFGLGLTAPIWLILFGRPPLEAIQAGTPVVLMAMAGLAITLALGAVAQRLRRPTVDDEQAVEPLNALDANDRRDRVVHLVTMLMFLLPFITIVIGVLFQHVIDADSRGSF